MCVTKTCKVSHFQKPDVKVCEDNVFRINLKVDALSGFFCYKLYQAEGLHGGMGVCLWA